jgi:hypothetical protein
MTVDMNLNEFMRSYEAKMAQNTNNSLKQRIFIHLDDVLGKKSIVESYIEYLIIKTHNRQYLECSYEFS